MIEIKHLSKSRINLEMTDLNLVFETGSLNLILAKNSGGKSTLLKLIAGAIPQYSGTINLYGESIEDYKKTDSIGYVPSHMPLDNLVKIENIAAMMEDTFMNWDSQYFSDLLALMKISVFQKVGELSKGYSKLLMIAIAMAHRPKVFLLDEPTLGLDAKHKELLFNLIAVMLETGVNTVVVASNAIEDFEEICDQVVFLKDGAVDYSGSVLALLETYAVWRGELDKLPSVRTYGKIRYGAHYDVLVDKDTPGSVEASLKEIIILKGAKS